MCALIVCSECGKELGNTEEGRIEGHYAFDRKAFCIECWQKLNKYPKPLGFIDVIKKETGA